MPTETLQEILQDFDVQVTRLRNAVLAVLDKSTVLFERIREKRPEVIGEVLGVFVPYYKQYGWKNTDKLLIMVDDSEAFTLISRDIKDDGERNRVEELCRKAQMALSKMFSTEELGCTEGDPVSAMLTLARVLGDVFNLQRNFKKEIDLKSREGASLFPEMDLSQQIDVLSSSIGKMIVEADRVVGRLEILQKYKDTLYGTKLRLVDHYLSTVIEQPPQIKNIPQELLVKLQDFSAKIMPNLDISDVDYKIALLKKLQIIYLSFENKNIDPQYATELVNVILESAEAEWNMCQKMHQLAKQGRMEDSSFCETIVQKTRCVEFETYLFLEPTPKQKMDLVRFRANTVGNLLHPQMQVTPNETGARKLAANMVGTAVLSPECLVLPDLFQLVEDALIFPTERAAFFMCMERILMIKQPGLFVSVGSKIKGAISKPASSTETIEPQIANLIDLLNTPEMLPALQVIANNPPLKASFINFLGAAFPSLFAVPLNLAAFLEGMLSQSRLGASRIIIETIANVSKNHMETLRVLPTEVKIVLFEQLLNFYINRSAINLPFEDIQAMLEKLLLSLNVNDLVNRSLVCLLNDLIGGVGKFQLTREERNSFVLQSGNCFVTALQTIGKNFTENEMVLFLRTQMINLLFQVGDESTTQDPENMGKVFFVILGLSENNFSQEEGLLIVAKIMQMLQSDNIGANGLNFLNFLTQIISRRFSKDLYDKDVSAARKKIIFGVALSLISQDKNGSVSSQMLGIAESFVDANKKTPAFADELFDVLSGKLSALTSEEQFSFCTESLSYLTQYFSDEIPVYAIEKFTKLIQLISVIDKLENILCTMQPTEYRNELLLEVQKHIGLLFKQIIPPIEPAMQNAKTLEATAQRLTILCDWLSSTRPLSESVTRDIQQLLAQLETMLRSIQLPASLIGLKTTQSQQIPKNNPALLKVQSEFLSLCVLSNNVGLLNRAFSEKLVCASDLKGKIEGTVVRQIKNLLLQRLEDFRKLVQNPEYQAGTNLEKLRADVEMNVGFCEKITLLLERGVGMNDFVDNVYVPLGQILQDIAVKQRRFEPPWQQEGKSPRGVKKMPIFYPGQPSTSAAASVPVVVIVGPK